MSQIEHLTAYLRLVERGSFTAVSKELRVSQSTLSKWLAALEEEAQTTLIERSTRKQRVTEAGKRFYEGARGIVEQYESLLVHARENESAAPDLRGLLRVSVPGSFGRRFVVPLVARFASLHPELRVELLFSDRYVDLLEDNVDLALRLGSSESAGHALFPLRTYARRLVASRRYLKAHGAPERPHDLTKHECLAHATYGKETIWRFRKGRGRFVPVSVHGRITASDSDATLALAKKGFGVCLVASWLCDKEIGSGRLVQVLEDYDAPPAPLNAVVLNSRVSFPAIQKLVDFFNAELPS